MIKQVKITLEAEEGTRIQQSWAFNLYGALMERIKPEYADYLHNDGLKPVSQFLDTKNTNAANEAVWTVNMIGNEAVSEVYGFLNKFKNYYLEKHNKHIKVTGISDEKEVYESDLLQNFLSGEEVSRHICIEHISPCSFKSDERYVLIPTVDLIIKSAVLKWNAFSKEAIINDDDAINQLISSTWISRYNLRSVKYALKTTTIPSFSGWTELSIKGPEPMVRLFNLLMYYLGFSGLGIKTTLGMGGCTINLKNRKNKLK